MAIFITGTDTGVGKTHAAAGILYRYRNLNNIKYWKPVQTGTRTDPLDAETVERLTGLGEGYILPTTLSFKEPLSPHRAAELENCEIDIQTLEHKWREFESEGGRKSILIEGAGGILVPLNRKSTWIDFIRAINVPVVIAARTGLGTINHTLLTVDYLKSRGAVIAGILYCGEANEDNILTISRMSGVPSLGRFYFQSVNDFAQIDPDG
ncbi:MAG: dethiobiotin synthase, partial [Leptospirales bacterium]|nr:dethiobiotin synthase [Leptospirales bacterium]